MDDGRTFGELGLFGRIVVFVSIALVVSTASLLSTTPVAAISDCSGREMTPLDGDFVFTGEASGEGVAGLRVDDGSVNVISIEIDEVVRGSQLEVGDVFEVTSHGGSGCFADWENFVDGERYLVGVGPIGTNSQRLTYSTDWSGRFTRMGFVVGGAIVLFALLQMSDRSPRPRRDEVVIRRGEVQSQDPSKRNASR